MRENAHGEASRGATKLHVKIWNTAGDVNPKENAGGEDGFRRRGHRTIPESLESRRSRVRIAPLAPEDSHPRESRKPDYLRSERVSGQGGDSLKHPAFRISDPATLSR